MTFKYTVQLELTGAQALAKESCGNVRPTLQDLTIRNGVSRIVPEHLERYQCEPGFSFSSALVFQVLAAGMEAGSGLSC